MAFDKDTLEILHNLTKEGQERYQDMLEKKADEIIFKSKHPLKWAMQELSKFFKH